MSSVFENLVRVRSKRCYFLYLRVMEGVFIYFLYKSMRKKKSEPPEKTKAEPTTKLRN